MSNLFKVILLCAILSNTFTPCFSYEANTFTDSNSTASGVTRDAFTPSAFTPLTLTNATVEKLSGLPIANPVKVANSDEEEVSEMLETEASVFVPERVANLPNAQSDVASDFGSENTSLSENDRIASCPVSNDLLINRTGSVEAFKTAYKCLDGKELTAIVLEKGRKFEVKSIQPMSYETATGSEVMFETIYPERVFLSKDPSKIFFKGEVVNNKPPRRGGGSGTIKVQITGMQIENVTYPAEAYISKMNKKGVLFGSVSLPSTYKDNLARTVNTGTINNYYNFDPCNVVAQECVSNAVKPFYFLTGAALQTADLFISPLIALFAPGNEVYIPEGTEFEIKLENEVPVLEL